MESSEETKEITHVRWEIPDDVMEKILKHKKILGIVHLDKEITNEQAAIDLMRGRKLPKRIILEQ